MRHPLLVLLAITSPAIAQQWYDQNLSYYPGNPYERVHGAAFVVNGKAYYGYGEDDAGQMTSGLYMYDPATNTATGIGPWYESRSHCVGFGVNGFGYVGLGNIDGLGGTEYVTNVIHKYDATLQQWISTTQFPGGPRLDAIAFVIGNKAYVGGGMDVDTLLGTSVPSNDLWEYEPVGDTWTQRANLPAAISEGISFTANGKGYVMTTGNTALWEFDPIGNAWATRAPYPGAPYVGRVAFTLDGLGYVGCGTGGVVSYQNFFAYDAIADAWSTAPSMWDAFGRCYSMTFTIGSDAYVLGGQRNMFGSTVLADLWRLGEVTTPLPNTWTQRPFMPAVGRAHPVAFSVGGKGYVGGGYDAFDNYTDFWEYDPVAMTWTPRASMPPDADEGFSIGDTGYVTTNAVTQNFYAYDPVTNTWSPRADLPGGVRQYATSFVVEGKGYVGTGWTGSTRLNDLWAFDPATNSWTQRANVPVGLRYAFACGIGNKGVLFSGNMSGSSTITDHRYVYDPVTDTWTSSLNLLQRRQGAQGFAIGNMGYLSGGVAGGPTPMNTFFEYNAATDSYTTLAASAGGYRYDGVGFTIGDKGYIFGGRRNPNSSFITSFYLSNDLWEYAPSIINVSPRAFLDGPFDMIAGLMHDSLRTAGLLNTIDPYGANGYPYPGGNYTDLPVELPSTTGNDAVVDRVIVELRDAVDPAIVLATRHVWLQRDGDLVDMDGSSPVRSTMAPGDYYVAVRHRNHLGVMTATPLTLSSVPVAVDFTSPGTATYGTDARNIVGTVATLWAGDATFDRKVKYAGAGNDRDAVLVRIGGIVPSNTVNGYFPEDVNMDGVVKYVGAENDRERILETIGGINPANVRTAQVP